MAWELGFSFLEVEPDSLGAVNLINNNRGNLKVGHGGGILKMILSWLQKDWVVKVSHIFREGNRLTDCVTDLGLKLISDFAFRTRPPENVKLILFSDITCSVLTINF